MTCVIMSRPCAGSACARLHECICIAGASPARRQRKYRVQPNSLWLYFGALSVSAGTLVKKKGNDTRIAYYAGIAVACLVLGFLIGWGYFKTLQPRTGADVAFAIIGPLNISTQGYSFSATLALQTRSDDADWAKKNMPALSDALHQALFNSDPKIMRTPAGLVTLQSALARTLNGGADQPRVQQVLFTDLTLQSDE
jgi:hypothetical protein